MSNWATRYRTLPGLLIAQFAALIASVLVARRKGWWRPEGIITIFALLIFVLVTTTFELWYPVYYIPFVGLCLASAIQWIYETGRKYTLRIAMGIAGIAMLNAVLFDAYFSYLYLHKLRNETSITATASQVSTHIPRGSTVLLVGTPSLYWELTRLRDDLSLFDPLAIDTSRQDQLVQRVNVVVAMRAFQSSFDEYIDREIKKWEVASLRMGKKMYLAGSVGRDVPFAYRGSIFFMEPLVP